jgi:hypothetical protein
MKLLFTSPSEAEVGLLRGLLDKSGIACEVRNEITGANFPGAEFQPELWVLAEEDYARACEIRDDWHPAPAPKESDDLREGIESARTNARGLAVGGGVLLGGALVMGWRFARLGSWGQMAGVLILFGLLGGILLWSGLAQLRQRTKK